VQKIKQLASARREEVQLCFPETARCIRTILQRVAQGSGHGSIRILFAVSNVVKRHPALLAEVSKSPCREFVQRILQAAMRQKRMYTKSFTLSQICVAQYNLQISCEQFWQEMPETCIVAWDDRAACTVVYAYGKLYEAEAVPPPSERLRKLQHKIVVKHAAELDAQGVGMVAWSLSKQGILLGEALLPLQSASLSTAASMNAQQVAITMWAFATMNSGLGNAQEPLMCAVMRVSSTMTSQNVSNALWALAKMNIALGKAHKSLMDAVRWVSDDMIAQEVANIVWALSKMSLGLREVQEPLMRAVLRVSDSMTAQNVANTMWAFANMKSGLGQGQKPLMRAFMRVSDAMTPNLM
jgi:hypothetical protein